MKVIGVGLNKTGTSSLGRALEILGFDQHLSHDLVLTQKWREGKTSEILKKAEAYNNLEDWPWPLLYKELEQQFPDARFILTKRRSPEVWYDSLCRHAYRSGPTSFRKWVYGYYMPQGFKEKHIQFYHNHNKAVVNYFKENAPEKLLEVCWENGEGWRELCHFLEKEMPNIPFPLVNKAPNIKKEGIFKKVVKQSFYKIVYWYDQWI